MLKGSDLKVWPFCFSLFEKISYKCLVSFSGTLLNEEKTFCRSRSEPEGNKVISFLQLQGAFHVKSMMEITPRYAKKQ